MAHNIKGGVTSWGAPYANKPIEQQSKLAQFADSLMYDNPIANAYQAMVPASARLAIGNLIMPSPITEKNFSKKQLDTLREFNWNADRRSSKAILGQDEINDYRNSVGDTEDYVGVVDPISGKVRPRAFVDESINQIGRKGITQSDMYTNNHDYDFEMFGKPFGRKVQSVMNNPVADMQMSVGTYYPKKDNKGNTYIDDVYDFKNIKNKFPHDKSYGIMHKIMETYGTPVQMRINLGR